MNKLLIGMDQLSFFNNEDNIRPITRSFKLEDINVIGIGLDILRDRMKPEGENYIGSCPFQHIDTHPSFYLRQKNFYICYGCGAFGGPFSLLFRLTSHSDALDYLKKNFDVDISNKQDLTRLKVCIYSEKERLGSIDYVPLEYQ